MKLQITRAEYLQPDGRPVAEPVPYGSRVTLWLHWADADYVAEKPAYANTLGTYPFERDGRAGAVTIVENFALVPASGGLKLGNLAGAKLYFGDARPVTVEHVNDRNASFSFQALPMEQGPTLYLPYMDDIDNQITELPVLEVAPRAPFVRKPRFGVYDEWDDKEALVAPEEGLQRATVGIDRYMQSVSGRTKPSIVNGAFRSYLTIRGARWTEESMQAKTARHFPTPTTVNCLWFHNDPAMRYSEAGVTELIHGKFDTDIRTWVASLPLDVLAYGFALHEADLKGIGGAEAGDLRPETYRAGTRRFLEVAADEALRRGRTPQNFGIGGLLTEGPLARGVDDPWIWSRDLPRWLYDTGFLVGAWDPYFLMRPDGTREPFRGKVDAQGATYEKTGVTRLFIAETAQGLDYRHQRDVIVGTAADQRDHLEQLEKWLVEKGEFGILFSKELGWMSRHGWLREAAARKAYYIGERLNIPVVAL